MMREEIIKKLKKLQESDDYEVTHSKADELLCSLLDSLGYCDVVEEYIKVGKWYA